MRAKTEDPSGKPDCCATRRIADLNADDRPREKAIRNGIRSLSNAELLAITIGGGLPGKSAMDLSREMLALKDNSLANFSRMSVGEMCRLFKGVGPAKAVSIAAAFELGTRCRDEKARENAVVKTSEDARAYIRGTLERLDTEEFWILSLSRSNKIISADCVSRGGTVATVVDVKLIMKLAIDNLACGIIAVHNHPSGNPNPSGQDDSITRRLKEAAAIFDIKFLDHIIIAADRYYSYNDNGRL